VTGGRGRKCNSYWITSRKRGAIEDWKRKTLDRTFWRTRPGTGYGPVVKQSTWWVRYEYNNVKIFMRCVALFGTFQPAVRWHLQNTQDELCNRIC